MQFEEAHLWIAGLVPGELQAFDPVGEGPGFRLGVANLGAETFVSTLDFNRVDTGLVSEGLSVRSEIFTVARASEPTMMRAINAAGLLLFDAQGTIPAQPGTLLPDIAAAAELPSDLSVAHGLLVVPFVWGAAVPRYTEASQLTVLLQLLMLTPEEFDYARTYGIEALQQELVRAEVDLNDWSR